MCAQSCPTLWLHGLQPTSLLCSQDFPGKNTGVGCHFLFQGSFLTQGFNLCLLHLLLGRGILSHPPLGKCKNSSCRLEVRCFSYWMIAEISGFPNIGASWIWCVCARGRHNWVCVCVHSCLTLPGCQCHHNWYCGDDRQPPWNQVQSTLLKTDHFFVLKIPSSASNVSPISIVVSVCDTPKYWYSLCLSQSSCISSTSLSDLFPF